MHKCYHALEGVSQVRTTVDIPDELRAELVALAARKGLRGYSEIIQEAVALYLSESKKENRIKERASELRGVWKDEDADRIAEDIDSAWSGWKTE